MNPRSSSAFIGRTRLAATVVVLVGAFATVPLGVSSASAAPGTVLYAFTGGIDTTGVSGCTTLGDRCSLKGALAAAGGLSSGTVAIYLQSASAANSYNGESNALYNFNDPGLDVTIEPDPSLGAGAVSTFDARYLPGSSILTLSGSGSLTLNDVQMQNATSTTSGGALRITSTLSVTCNNCVFANNQTVGNSNGGAIAFDNGVAGDLTVNDSTFTNNWAIGVGGAIGEYASNGTMTITNSTFSGNHGDYGGAIGEGANGGGTLNVSGSTFTSNSAIWGGAIDNADIGGSSSAVVQYSTFVDNTAEAIGGAIASNVNSGSGNLVVLRSTINDGVATTPAVAGGGGTTVFAGSLIAGSQSSLCSGTISDAGYNVESDASASCGFTQSSDAVAGTDPGLSTLADNGGVTLTQQVSAASSAANSIPSTPSSVVSINATPYTLCANPDTDQTGVAQATATGCSRGALDATHLATSSVPSVTAPLASSSATQSYSLAATGGSGSGAYVFSTSSPNCSIVSSTLSFTGMVVPSTCEVTVVRSAQGAYADSSPSVAQAFTFVAVPQPLPLVLTSTRGRFSTPVTLTTSGGSGTGATTYVVVNGSATGCALATLNTLITTTAGTCVVQATKAASGIYTSSTSSLTRVGVAAILPSAPLLHLLSEHAGVAVLSVALRSLGGDPMTALQYSLNAGAWKSAIRLGHGKVEITSLRRGTITSVRVRVYTASGHSPASTPVRVQAK